MLLSQEFDVTLIGENGLVVMAGAKGVEWYSICSVPAIIMSRPPLSSLHGLLSYSVVGVWSQTNDYTVCMNGQSHWSRDTIHSYMKTQH